MDIKNEMNSYIFQCYKAFEKNKPEEAKNITLVKTTKTPYMPCEYCCSKIKYVLENKLVNVMVTKNAISIDDACGFWSTGFSINFCPMCGRKL